jgi:hypothetical protein
MRNPFLAPGSSSLTAISGAEIGSKLKVAKLRAEPMAEPYSDDLRKKVLKPYAAGRGSLEELVGQFGVRLRNVSRASPIDGHHERSGKFRELRGST